MKCVSRIACSTLVLGFTLGPAAAWAADSSAPQGAARYKKAEHDVEGVPQTQLTRPQAPPKEKKQSGPVISLEDFVGQRQDKIIQITGKQIEIIQRLVRTTDDDNAEKPDLWFRLAELYAENQRYFFFKAHQLDQKIFEAQGGGKSQLEREKAGYEKQQEQWLLEAVKAYIEASKFRKYPRMDEVLFKLAYLLQTVKKEDQAREFFHRLIKDYPNSKYVPEAYLSFGEYFFEKQEMESALKFYKRVEEFPRSPVYGYAIYKQGWCFINLGDFKKALEIFVSVIRISKEGKAGDKRQNAALEREAKKDVVKAYARVGTPDKAWDFFRRVGDDMAPKMFEALGELYWEQGMFKESSLVYHQLIDMNKTSARICEWQNKIVRNTLSAGTKRDQVQEIGRLGLAYQHVSKMQGVKKDVLEECHNAFHDTSKELALIWHKEAQKTKNPDTYALVRYVYKIYLDNFGKEKGAVEMAFYYAEVLWVTENWREAAEQYTKVVEMDPKGKYVQEAAYAAVLAWKNALNIDDQGSGPVDKGTKDEKELKPRAIPEYQQKMIAAFDTYIKYVPTSDMLVKIKYRKARIFYEYNHFDEAVKLFGDIVDHHVKDELAIYSANLMLDALNAQGKTKEVIAWVDKFIENPELMKDAEFKKQMVALKVDSMDLAARQAEKEGNLKECGLMFLAAAESTAPETDKHAERLYNAGLCFQKARLIGRAIQAREELIKTHPKDNRAQKALFFIASNFQQIASYTRSAEYFEQFATKYPGEKQAITALGNAYSFRLGTMEFEKAIDDMNSYIKFYGERQPKDVADKVFQLADVYERKGDSDGLTKHLQNYISKWGSKGSAEKLMFAHFRLGELAWKKSCPKGGENGACIEIKRVSATGRQKLFADMNKKITDKHKKLKEKGRTQCGPPTHAKITVFDRNKAVAKQAQDHFDTVLKLYKADMKKLPADRQAVAQSAAAGAQFYKAEMVYEDFLRVKFPEGLDFQTPTQYDTKRKADAKKKKSAESVKKFEAYLKQKGELGTRLAGAGKDKKGLYDLVTEFKVAHWTVAAAARIGQVWSNFMDQLYTAEIPKELKEQDEWGNRPREIYCDALVDKAEPLEKKAVEAYDICLRAAKEKSWFNEWSAMCETELNQMQPSEYPLAAEAKPDPGYVTTMMTPAQVIPDLPQNVATIANK